MGFRSSSPQRGWQLTSRGCVLLKQHFFLIAVPLEGSALKGVDALYSIVRMPAGVPVATVAIGSAGARNAAVLAAEILALNDSAIKQKLAEFKKNGAKF